MKMKILSRLSLVLVFAMGLQPTFGQKKAALDYTSETFAPSITYESLLRHFGAGSTKAGYWNFNYFTATFLPSLDVEGNPVQYGLYSEPNQERIFLKLYQNNVLVSTMPFTTEGASTKMCQLQTTSSYILGEEGLAIKEGNYRMEFYLDDKIFYKFEYSVSKKANDDPYSEVKEFYFSKGPWENMAYIEQQKGGNAIFHFYILNDVITADPSNPRQVSKQYDWNLKLYKNTVLYASAKERYDDIERGEWNDVSSALKLVTETEAGDYFSFNSLEDGKYTMKATVVGEAASRNFDFEIKGGKITTTTKQNRAVHTDPLTLVEGGRSFYWLDRKK